MSLNAPCDLVVILHSSKDHFVSEVGPDAVIWQCGTIIRTTKSVSSDIKDHGTRSGMQQGHVLLFGSVVPEAEPQSQ